MIIGMIIWSLTKVIYTEDYLWNQFSSVSFFQSCIWQPKKMYSDSQRWASKMYFAKKKCCFKLEKVQRIQGISSLIVLFEKGLRASKDFKIFGKFQMFSFRQVRYINYILRLTWPHCIQCPKFFFHIRIILVLMIKKCAVTFIKDNNWTQRSHEWSL